MVSPQRIDIQLESKPYIMYDDVKDTELPVLMVVLNGRRRAEFIKFQAETLKVNASGQPTDLKDMGKVQAHLLSLCLCTVKMEGGEPVESGGSWIGDKALTKDQISVWPAHVIDFLFKEAAALNKLNETEEEVKNG